MNTITKNYTDTKNLPVLLDNELKLVQQIKKNASVFVNNYSISPEPEILDAHILVLMGNILS